MILCEFMQQLIPDLPGVPKNVEIFGRISVVEYVLFHYQYKHHLLGSIQSWKEGIKTKETFQKGPVCFAFLRFHRERNELAKQRLQQAV